MLTLKSANVLMWALWVCVFLGTPFNSFAGWSSKKKLKLPELNYDIKKPLKAVRECQEEVRQCLACNGEIAHVDSDPRYKNKLGYLEEKRKRAHEPYVLLPKGVKSFKDCHHFSVFGHGLSDGTAKVFARAEDIRSAGACVYVFPLRGHIGLATEKEALEVFENYSELAAAWDRDYEELVLALHKENPTATIQLDGFSTSGLLAMKGCSQRNGKPLYSRWKDLAHKITNSNTFGNPLFATGNSLFGVANRFGVAHVINWCYGKKNLHNVSNFGFKPISGKGGVRPETPLTHLPMSRGAQCAFLSLNRSVSADVVPKAMSLKETSDFSCHMRTYVGACDTVVNKKKLGKFWRAKQKNSEMVIVGNRDCRGTYAFNKKRAEYYSSPKKARVVLNGQRAAAELWPSQEVYTTLATDVENVGHSGIMYARDTKGKPSRQCYTLSGEGSPLKAHLKVSAHFRAAIQNDLKKLRSESHDFRKTPSSQVTE